MPEENCSPTAHNETTQPDDQGQHDGASPRQTLEGPDVVAVGTETRVPPSDMILEAVRAAADRLQGAFQRWNESSTPAEQRKQLTDDINQKVRNQLGRIRHALEAELGKANARGDHQAIQIIHLALVRQVQCENELRENVDKWASKWAPNLDLPCEVQALIRRQTADHVTEPVAFIRDSSDEELNQLVQEWIVEEKTRQNRAGNQMQHQHVGWDEATEARNKWIYEQAMNGVVWETIKSKLRSKPKKWQRINSVNGIKKAAIAYAERHSLPLPPKRQPGRRSSR